MNKIVLHTLPLLFTITVCAQEMTVNSLDLNQSSQIYLDSLSFFNDTVFFEDNSFLVDQTCSGEWGGSIWFTNKKSNVTTGCKATCPKSIHKIKGSFFVTASLGHGGGGLSIIEIKNPNKLSKPKPPKPSYDTIKETDSAYSFYYVGDFESKSLKGSKTLIDTFGITAFTGFVFNNELYQITFANNDVELGKMMDKSSGMLEDWPMSIFLTKMENNRLTTIDTLVWYYNMKTPEYYDKKLYKINPTHCLLYLPEEDNGLYIEIKNNNINIYRKTTYNTK